MCRALATALSFILLLALVAGGAIAGGEGRPRITGRRPVNALPLRHADLPALRRLGLALALHGVHEAGHTTIDYRGARAKATFPTFFTGYVRSACPREAVRRLMVRTADVRVTYPRVDWSASLSFSIFLVSRTPRGFVGWGQIH